MASQHRGPKPEDFGLDTDDIPRLREIAKEHDRQIGRAFFATAGVCGVVATIAIEVLTPECLLRYVPWIYPVFLLICTLLSLATVAAPIAIAICSYLADPRLARLRAFDRAVRRRTKRRDAAWLRLTDQQFASRLAETLRANGYEVELADVTTDSDVQIWLLGSGTLGEFDRTPVQYKRWERPAGVRVVRELLKVMSSLGCSSGVLVSRCGFSKRASEFAAENGIRTLGHGHLVNLYERVADDKRGVNGTGLRDGHES